MDEKDVTTTPGDPSQPTEAQADSQNNPYNEENLLEMIRELMDSNKRLYAKSNLTDQEADTYAKLASFGEYHRTPSLIRYVNRQLEYKMSIRGQRIDQLTGVYRQGTENARRKSLKDKIIDLG